MNHDISVQLRGWEYNANEVTVRKIIGVDGSEKIQMRLDLGLLQMETTGRPDGLHPNGHDSLLEYHLSRRSTHEQVHGDIEGFELASDECSDIKQEAMQYYYRYLSLFHLGEYAGVIRDTQRNLHAFDLVRDHSEDDNERASLEQFRPYVLMMNTRAKACLLLEDEEFDFALEKIESGIGRIQDFFFEVERPDLAENCREIAFLRDWSERIRSNRPLSPQERLKQELQIAVEAEDYERAAKLRDEIQELVA